MGGRAGSIERFDDVHIHAAAVNAWQQTYSQISAGRLESSLMQMSRPACHLFREHINQRVVQHGQAPGGRVCFALPIAAPGTVHMQGREADDKSLFCLHGGQEFMFHMPRGMDMLAITFDETFFEAQLDGLFEGARVAKIRGLLRQPVIKVSPRRLLACRQRLLALFAQACARAGQETQAWERAPLLLESRLLAELLALLADPACDARQRQIGSTYSYIVETLHRDTLGNAVGVRSVFEASRRLNVSRRTVQNSFRSVAETTPINYLRALRLNGVRRELMSTGAAHTSIGEAAAHWGFAHMSHFAQAYRALFDELPSQTLRAKTRATTGTRAGAWPDLTVRHIAPVSEIPTALPAPGQKSPAP